MLQLIPGQEFPDRKYSKKFVKCICDCGNPNELSIRWNTFSKKNPTCGKCDLYKWISENRIRYGKLTLACEIVQVTALRSKVPWNCDCGKTKLIRVFSVISGNTTSCGCSYSDKTDTKHKRVNQTKLFSEWKIEFPDLISSPVDSWTRKSRNVCEFKCHCGKTFSDNFGNYRLEKKCGHCYDVTLNENDLIGGFRYTGKLTTISSNSRGRLNFIHELCGNNISISFKDAKTKNKCRLCNSINTEGKNFGRLKFKNHGIYSKFSTEKVEFICSCGNNFISMISNVLNGTTKSCGNCRKNVVDWQTQLSFLLQNSAYPISPDGFPSGGVKPLESITSGRNPFRAECPVCHNEYKPRLNDIKRGLSLTCGCASNRVSSGQNELYEFIKPTCDDAVLEHSIGSMKYDIAIPSRKLAIEYQGLIWHSNDDSKSRDIKKYKNALTNGWSFISIYEDEWLGKKEIFKNIIINRLGSSTHRSIRPNLIKITIVEKKVADNFYSKNHYIGPCKPHITYGAFFNNELLACMSFSTPTRQSRHQFELVRMASIPVVRIHGIWSKMFKKFISEHNPTSVVSFSDNRLFSGSIYEKLGFKLDSEIRSDYYWTKGNKRFHKSKLRKPNGHIGTETQLRESEGYRKIWDLGKKRWIWNV